MDILYGLALSLHLGFEQDYNMIHPQVRLQHDNYIAGAYYNSEDSMSLYAGLEFEKESWNYEIGMVTGYNSASIKPFVRSTVDLSNNVKGFIVPSIETVNDKENFGIVVGLEIWNQ